MKKLFLVLFMLVFVFQAFGQGYKYDKLSPFTDKRVKQSIYELRDNAQLPKIRGTWYYVDPAVTTVSASKASGKTQAKAFRELEDAYAACTSGAGDGIIMYSYGTTSGTTTQYLSTPINWSKHNITWIGIAAPINFFGRARVSDSSGIDSLDFMINFSGDNNTIYNINFFNTPDTVEVVHGAIKVSGNRNVFLNCHMSCVPTTMAATKADIIIDGAQEIGFYHCGIGTDTKDMGNNAACHIYVDGSATRLFFENCRAISYVSTGTAFGGISFADASAIQGAIYFDDCKFQSWDSNGAAPSLASWFIGTKPTSGLLNLHNCSATGYAAWDATGGNDRVYTNQPASNAAGGITVTP